MRYAIAAVMALPSALLAQPCTPQWSALGSGVNSEVYSLGTFAGSLLAGGAFTQAGSGTARHIARWHQEAWAEFGGGLWAPANTLAARAMIIHDDGSGPAFFAAGDFITAGGTAAYYIARWNAAAGTWDALGPGASASVHALAEFDDGGGRRLYAGGRFASPGARIASWDGQAWAPLGAGVSGTLQPSVRALAVGAGAVGDVLYAGGSFTTAGTGPASAVAAWDGSAWSPLGGGVNGTVFALAVFHGDLYAGGDFTAAGGLPAARLARWDVHGWAEVGGGFSGPYFPAVHALAVSPGAGLYVGGRFDAAGTTPANSVVLWDGSAWLALGGGLTAGMNPWVNTLLLASEPGGEALYAGGGFGDAGGVPASGIARWGCPASACYPDCNADGTVSLADFGCFQTRFALGDPYADCNGDVQLNLGDFGCFQTKFALGCP